MSVPGFWRQFNYDNRRLTLNDKTQVNNVWYLFPQGNGPAGSHTFTTFTALKPQLRCRDLILLSGVLREQAIAPVGVYDVTILGAANKARQATSGGVPTGGGASWLAPTSPVALTPLLQLIEQGWIIDNIQFAGVAASDCIRFRRMETATIPDASHGIVRNCYFLGGGAAAHGINLGECAYVEIENCRFQSVPGTAIRRTADGGIANTNHARIHDCEFESNGNDIVLASGDNIAVTHNKFWDAVDGARKFIQVTGANLFVRDNDFVQLATAGYSVANGFEGGATDSWRVIVTDAADPIVAVPA